MRAVKEIRDLATLRALAQPTRVAILEHLAVPSSVTELARALKVPRTRLYHHIALLRAKGLVRVARKRRSGAMTEQVYAPTAKSFRPHPDLLSSGRFETRVEAIATLVLDTTSSDLRRALLSGEASLARRDGHRQVGVARSIALLTPVQADAFIGELERLVARFDKASRASEDSRPFALTWALYPASRRIG
jgi:DNA-binding transcriptional ArsR family regulator